MFTSVSLANQVAIVTPLPQEQIGFQPGDVLGFNLENTDGDDGGVVILMDSSEQGDNGYETEEVWYADFSSPVFGNPECLLAVGSQPPGRALNTRTSAAPVISASYAITSCPRGIVPTPPPPATGDSSTGNPQPTTNPGSDRDDTPSPPFTDHHGNGGLNTEIMAGLIIGIVVIITMITVSVVAVVVVIAILFNKRRGKSTTIPVPTAANQAYGLNTYKGVEESIYTYPGPEMDVDNTIEAKQNVAYVANTDVIIEANEAYYVTRIVTERNEAYATSIMTAGNEAYGTNNIIITEENQAYATSIATEKNAAYEPVTTTDTIDVYDS